MPSLLRHAIAVLAFQLLTVSILLAQAPPRIASSDIYDAIEKLGVLGSALYVAAHPDDENTRMISYLANEVKVHTTYLSMTRGDGGQNLLGPEMREYLGIIRTQELLAARRIDGGNQLFTRANDFGYSKTPEETLDFWNKDEVMADVVWAIRKTRPDVIINRFPHEHINGNHGHHTTSAMLSYEAFDLAGDPDAYPEQLQFVEPWQPKRLFFNTSWWFYGSRDRFAEADKSRMLGIDVGVYFPEKGLSNPEIAAKSRSMHKSQGFGSSGSRGSQTEFLELIKGEMPSDKTDIFDGIDISWERITETSLIERSIYQIQRMFDHSQPHLSIPPLLRLAESIEQLEPSYWRDKKLEEIRDIIVMCTGVYAVARAEDYWAAPGDSLSIQLEITNRSEADVRLFDVKYGSTSLLDSIISCTANEAIILDETIKLHEQADLTSPYWLNDSGTEGMYSVKDQRLRGLPENQRDQGVTLTLNIAGERVELFRPFVFRTTDPVDGEVFRPFEVVTPVFVNFSRNLQVMASNEGRPVQVKVKSATTNASGEVRLNMPDNWRAEPQSHSFSLDEKGDEEVFNFTIFPPGKQSVSQMSASVTMNGMEYSDALVEIDYDHIPAQTILEPAQAKIVRVDLKRAGERVAYIMGAGDDIPASLEEVGYDVDVLPEEGVDLTTLKGYDAVILGVRAYNTSDRIKFYQDDIFEYVNQGGTVITQYNTSRRLKVESLAPVPLKLSRNRVTDESAEVNFVAPDHPVLHFPNAITGEDFNDWVQERGLYFPDEWDDSFIPILSMRDPGEEPTEGSLLVAEYGEGHFVYTGLSWFRQLPAGVPGAYRIFTNLIALGNTSRS